MAIKQQESHAGNQNNNKLSLAFGSTLLSSTASESLPIRLSSIFLQRIGAALNLDSNITEKDNKNLTANKSLYDKKMHKNIADFRASPTTTYTSNPIQFNPIVCFS